MNQYPQERVLPYNKEESKTAQVEKLFDNIAADYDKYNHTASFGFDRSWRRKAIRKLKPYSPSRIMDVATGTGDFAIQTFLRLRPRQLTGVDLSEGMLSVGRQKVIRAGLSEHIRFLKEDCSRLSFPDSSFDAVTVAFGMRNFENLDVCLKELLRVLGVGGHLVILELSEPKNVIVKLLFDIYSGFIMPLIGKLMSGDMRAYKYLPKSIKAFPQGEVMKGILERSGFRDVEFERLTLGVCTLYLATK